MRYSEINKNILVRKSIFNTLFFILGFTLVFVILGAGAGTISELLATHRRIITITGGVIIIVLSLHVVGLINITFLNLYGKSYCKPGAGGLIGGFILGITFASAWTPCIGPILSSILILAATKDTILKGVYLLTAYSIGLGIPFLFAVSAYAYFLGFSNFLRKHLKTIKLVSGILLLSIGVILILGQFEKLSQLISYLPDLTLISTQRVSVFIALFAGFVSFLSPCVLPIIPSYITYITGISTADFEARIKYSGN